MLMKQCAPIIKQIQNIPNQEENEKIHSISNTTFPEKLFTLLVSLIPLPQFTIDIIEILSSLVSQDTRNSICTDDFYSIARFFIDSDNEVCVPISFLLKSLCEYPLFPDGFGQQIVPLLSLLLFSEYEKSVSNSIQAMILASDNGLDVYNFSTEYQITENLTSLISSQHAPKVIELLSKFCTKGDVVISEMKLHGTVSSITSAINSDNDAVISAGIKFFMSWFKSTKEELEYLFDQICIIDFSNVCALSSIRTKMIMLELIFEMINRSTCNRIVHIITPSFVETSLEMLDVCGLQYRHDLFQCLRSAIIKCQHLQPFVSRILNAMHASIDEIPQELVEIEALLEQ